MSKIDVFYRVDDGGYEPIRAHLTDAGWDIRSPEFIILKAHDSIFVDTKLRMLIPGGYVGMIKSKSGLNVKHGITAEGVVDAYYTGTIGVKLYNNSDEDYFFDKGDKLTQIVIMPIPEVEMTQVTKLEKTERNEGGFGSSGK